jgi:hypothetical protein
MARIITIQPEAFVDNVWVGKEGKIVEGKKLPYPFHVDAETGNVENQDFWQGDPVRVLGFQDDEDVQRINLWWAEVAVTDPERVVGKFPVMLQSDGTIYTYTVKVESVSVREVSA